MSRPAVLNRTESLFWDLITAPEGVRPGLDALVRDGRATPAALDEMIAGDERLPASERLDIYANMYFFRLLDCLREDFPRLASALGEDRFHNLATDYLLAHPSEHPSLRYLGRRLPEFLASHALAGESPCLPDLARLEWTRADLFDAADARTLTRDDLARLAQDTAGDLPLRAVPAFRLLRLDHDAPRLWRELRDRGATSADASAGAGNTTGEVAGGETADATWGAGAANAARLGDAASGPRCASGHVHQDRPAPPLPKQARKKTAVRVWRSGFTVYHRAVDEEEAALLDLLEEGTTLARVAQRLSAGRSQAKATEALGSVLQVWIDGGMLEAESR